MFYCRNSDGLLENVHFNIHFSSDSNTRIFAQEVKDVLVTSLNITGELPEVDMESVTVTERKPQEQPGRRRKVVHNTHHRGHYNDNQDTDYSSYQGKK